ncbi:MAG: SpoVA/SpoVAEb family sporulation membrane protein [Clostridia bacterium]|nr:SpoVA/SpoVAEb family sporulation membrane protein [Clostridia bacterium]
MQRNEEFKSVCQKHMPRSKIFSHLLSAFLIGGAICFIGELLASLFLYLGLGVKESYLCVTLTLIVLASLATALGFFDRIAVLAGAGTLLPVTGFSNAITSSAIDSKSEGFITGVGTKIFTVAGPVILYSTLAGTVYGFVFYIYNLFL